MSSKRQSTRRQFLATTGAVAAAGTLLTAGGVHAEGSDTIKVGLIGCGGRGSGAAENVLHSARGVEIVAIGDFFKPKADNLGRRLTDFAKEDKRCQDLGNKVNLEGRTFGGLDAYEKVINAPGVNYVILATPPGFRPMHIQAAVAAGKNIFTEKPVGVDGPGIRKVMAAYDDANKKNLGIAAGTQRRHQAPYIETVKQIKDGAIGTIVGGRCHWNQGNIWFRTRRPQMRDLDYQVENWYHFVWLCGDHIVEQHVHNIDVINWILGEHPLRCVGMGGRTMPCADPNVDGHIYNFFSIDFEYPNGVHILSTCRQINGCANSISEAVVGTKGTSQVNEHLINGQRVARRGGTDPYVQEHTDLIESLRAGKPINELKNVAESTLCSIMGRMSAYTGKAVTWEQALHSKLDTMPEKLDLDMKLEAAPVAVPGKTPLI